MQGFIAPDIVQGNGQRLFDQSSYFEPPHHAVDLRRGRVDVNAVVPLQGGVFGPCAGRRLDSGAGIRQDVRCETEGIRLASFIRLWRSDRRPTIAPLTVMVAVYPASRIRNLRRLTR